LTGTISPAQTDDNMWTCSYFSYQFDINASVKEVDATISTSNLVNYYLMSQNQFNQFVDLCGASYASLQVEYGTTSYALKWAHPVPGDYYIILENTSTSTVTYNIQLATN
jgi:hypothetical protein